MNNEEFKLYFNKTAIAYMFITLIIVVIIDIVVLLYFDALPVSELFLVKFFFFVACCALSSEEKKSIGIESTNYGAIVDFSAIYLGLWCVVIDVVLGNQLSKFVGLILLLSLPSVFAFMGRLVVFYHFSKNNLVAFIVPFLGRGVTVLWGMMSILFLLYGEWNWYFLAFIYGE